MKIFSSILSVIKSILGIKSAPATTPVNTDPSGLLAEAKQAAIDAANAAGEVVNVIDQAVHLVFPDGVTADLLQDLITIVQKATSDAKAAGTPAPSMAVLQPGQTVVVSTPLAIVADVKNAAANAEKYVEKIASEVEAEAKKVVGEVETFFTRNDPAPAAAPVVAAVTAKEIEPAAASLTADALTIDAPALTVTGTVLPAPEVAPLPEVDPVVPQALPTLDSIDAEIITALEAATDTETRDALLAMRAAITRANFIRVRYAKVHPTVAPTAQ